MGHSCSSVNKNYSENQVVPSSALESISHESKGALLHSDSRHGDGHLIASNSHSHLKVNVFDTNNPYEILAAESRLAEARGESVSDGFVPHTANKLDKRHVHEAQHPSRRDKQSPNSINNINNSITKKLHLQVGDERYQEEVVTNYNLQEAAEKHHFHQQLLHSESILRQKQHSQSHLLTQQQHPSVKPSPDITNHTNVTVSPRDSQTQSTTLPHHHHMHNNNSNNNNDNNINIATINHHLHHTPIPTNQ